MKTLPVRSQQQKAASVCFSGLADALIDRFAPGESFLRAVPVSDSLFAQLPAKQHHLPVHFAGKIEQADVEVFDLHSDGIDLGHGIPDPPNRLLPLGLASRQMDDVQEHAPAQKDAVGGFL